MEPAEDHRQQAAEAAADRLSQTYGAAVIGGLPVVRGSRARFITRGMTNLRRAEGTRKAGERKLRKYQLDWDTKEEFRRHKARQGATRDNPKWGFKRPWKCRFAEDEFPGGGELDDYSPKAQGPAPMPPRERTRAAARAKGQAGDVQGAPG